MTCSLRRRSRTSVDKVGLEILFLQISYLNFVIVELQSESVTSTLFFLNIDLRLNGIFDFLLSS